MLSTALLLGSLAAAASRSALRSELVAPQGLVTSARLRRIDGISRDRLFPPDAHSQTRSTHRRMMSTWKSAPEVAAGAPVLYPTDFGADPTGKADSTTAFKQLIAALLARNSSSHHMADTIVDLGGATVDLAGGDYLISSPIAIPQYYGNFHIIDGTLRASSSFPAAGFLIEVGSATPRCAPPSGQGSCNEVIGLRGLTVDASHVAAGCINIRDTMGATIDSSSLIIGFNDAGIRIDGGHEVMVEETWIAAYYWDSPMKEKNPATGILINSNDHFVTNTIVFSARVGIQNNGAANLFSGVHTWNSATGNGGTGIVNANSQNRYEGCYLDFTHLSLTNAQQISISNGFYLGGAQIMFAAPKAGSVVYGTSIVGNVWYDTNRAPLAVNETLGTWTAITDLYVAGTSLQQGQSVTHNVRASMSVTPSGANSQAVDFSSALLFPHAPIQSATVQIVGGASTGAPVAYVGALPNAGSPLTVTVETPSPAALNGLKLVVTADQSAHLGF